MTNPLTRPISAWNEGANWTASLLRTPFRRRVTAFGVPLVLPWIYSLFPLETPSISRPATWIIPVLFGIILLFITDAYARSEQLQDPEHIDRKDVIQLENTIKAFRLGDHRRSLPQALFEMVDPWIDDGAWRAVLVKKTHERESSSHANSWLTWSIIAECSSDESVTSFETGWRQSAKPLEHVEEVCSQRLHKGKLLVEDSESFSAASTTTSKERRLEKWKLTAKDLTQVHFPIDRLIALAWYHTNSCPQEDGRRSIYALLIELKNGQGVSQAYEDEVYDGDTTRPQTLDYWLDSVDLVSASQDWLKRPPFVRAPAS